MPKAADEPRNTGESPMDRMIRFGTALFAVRKDELPKRDERAKLDRKSVPKAKPRADA